VVPAAAVHESVAGVNLQASSAVRALAHVAILQVTSLRYILMLALQFALQVWASASLM
jgi:hypothetical protein